MDCRLRVPAPARGLQNSGGAGFEVAVVCLSDGFRGEARVHVSVRAAGEESSVVTISEDAVSGPARLVPPPLRRMMITLRNRETLHRLALLARGRHEHR